MSALENAVHLTINNVSDGWSTVYGVPTETQWAIFYLPNGVTLTFRESTLVEMGHLLTVALHEMDERRQKQNEQQTPVAEASL